MKSADEVRRAVREKYDALARGGRPGGGCAADECTNVGEDYAGVEGYFGGADLGLGCGLPTEAAGICEGETVVDLGSGAGNDAFIARARVGASGRVVGVDASASMVEKARENARKLGYGNVEFVRGEIESLPLEGGGADVVISNCVLNLVPDKARAFREIFRVLRRGGRFCISDVVTEGAWEPSLKAAAEEYVGCVAGAPDREEYLAALGAAGFTNVSILKQRRIDMPGMRGESDARVLSVTVYGEKP